MTVALIGCGAVSENLYAPALDSLATEGLIETVALVDPVQDRVSKIGKTLTTARQFRDLDAIFTEITPTLAIVATPHNLHANLTVACLEKGVHVLCEKPMALSVAECDRMIATAEKASCVLAVGHFRRFFPSCRLIKNVLDSGSLGPVRSFRFLEGEVYSWPVQFASFFKRLESGGGVLIDAGAHTLNLLLWWLGDVEDVQYRDDAMGGVEANCWMHLKMTSGAEGIVQLSRDWPLPNRYVIECEKGWIAYICDVVDRVECGFHGSDYVLNAEIQRMATTNQSRVRYRDPVIPKFMDCFVVQLRNVVAAISGTECLEVSGVEARRTMALIEKCYRNRILLNMTWLEQDELRHARQLANV